MSVDTPATIPTISCKLPKPKLAKVPPSPAIETRSITYNLQ